MSEQEFGLEIEQLRRLWEEGKQSGIANPAEVNEAQQKARQRLARLREGPSFAEDPISFRRTASQAADSTLLGGSRGL